MNAPPPRLQRTLAGPVSLSGIGLHTGTASTVTFKPAPADTGYLLVRTDRPGKPGIRPRPGLVSQTIRGTTLQENGVEVHTVEHILAALAGLNIDNCVIELETNEPPIMDGSAKAFVDALQRAGVEEIPDSPSKGYNLSEPLIIEEKGKYIVGWPYPGLRISYILDYENSWLQSRRVDLEINPETFQNLLAPSRTYCFEHEIAWLKSRGLGRGGNLENAIVVSEQGIKNGPLRFEHELVYHKILDFIGDLALLGCPVQGHFVAWRSGHELNVRMVEHLRRKKNREEKIQGGMNRVIIHTKEIEELLPHRYPMLLIDRVIDLVEGKRVVGIKNVTMNESFFQGHFPGHPIMPGVLIIEAMAQCGGVLLMKSVPDAKNKVVYFVGIDNVRFRKPVIPGDQLRFELEVEKCRSNIAKMHGRAFVGEDLVCEADMMSSLVDKQ